MAGRVTTSLAVRLSVVIPTLDEAAELPATLRHVAAVPEVMEIIVSDGGSRDGTEAVARVAGARWISGLPGRGRQLRTGAAAAVGDVVVLLHADTWLPVNAGRAIASALQSPAADAATGEAPAVVGGGFQKEFREGSWLLRSTARWRSIAYFRLTGRLFGDQAIFVRREILEATGGIPELPLMEEFALCHQISNRGSLTLLPVAVCTSGRSFRRRGVWRTWWLMWCLQRAWRRGVPAEELARRYRAQR